MTDIWKITPLIALLAAMPAAAQTTGDDDGAAAPADGQAAETPAEDAPADDAGAGDDGAAAGEGDDVVADGVNPRPGELSMGEEVAEEGETPVGGTYVAETHGDWEQRCVRSEDGNDPCQLYQLLRDQDDNPVAEISIFGLPEGQQAAAGATIITPLETLLTQQVTIRVDGGNPRRFPFTFCAQNGCYARVGFTGADIDAFKRGSEAVMTIVPFVAPDQQIDLTVSLSGFTAGYDAVNASNAEARGAQQQQE